MNFRHLRYFVAASEHGSFRKAGAALGVQESTISRRIRDMEDGLGSALFHRHSGGVCLTVAGQRLLSKAQKVLRYINEGAEIVDAVGRGTEGQLRVGIFSSLASGFLQDLLRTFAAEHPGVHVEVADGNPAEHVAAIRQFRLDIAFLTGTLEWPRCETTYLWSERVFVVLPEAHALARKEEVKWHDLAHETFIVSDVPPGQEVHDYLVQRVADLGHHPKIQAQFVGRDNLLTLVAIGSGLTVMSEAATAAHVPGICYRPIIGEVLPFTGAALRGAHRAWVRQRGWRRPAILFRDGKARVRGPCAACRVGWTWAAGKSSAAAIADPARLTADRPLEGRGAVLFPSLRILAGMVVAHPPSSPLRRCRQAQDAAGVFQRRLGGACLSEDLQKVAEDLARAGSAGGRAQGWIKNSGYEYGSFMHSVIRKEIIKLDGFERNDMFSRHR